MQWWDGTGAAKVYGRDTEAMLLERANGSRSLLTMAATGHDDEASRIICATVAKLHAPRNKLLPPLIPLAQWFRELTPAARTRGGALADCHRIAKALLADPRDQTVLHGDIHHSNILDFEGHGWLAIDPKGLFGERGFDYANIFANPDLATVTHPGRLQTQLRIVSAEANIEPKRLLRWIAAYCGLSAAWFLQEGATAEAQSPLTVAHIALAELRC
jgi:streptomycin 6-kinase